MPSIAGTSGPGADLSAEKWFEFFEKTAGKYEPESVGSSSDQEIIKKRLKVLGTYLCDAVKEEYGIDCNSYLGKNRNIIEFPEKFFQAVFPTLEKSTSDNICTWPYYFLLLQKIYKNLPASLSEMLRQLREFNRNTLWLHVPEITTDSTSQVWQDTDQAAYLLSAFTLLSSARQVELENKNGIPLAEKTKIFRQVQNLFEVPTAPSDAVFPNAGTPQAGTGLYTTAVAPDGATILYETPASSYVIITVHELISLCAAALSAPDTELLQTIYNICIRTPIVLQPGSNDAFAAKELLSKIHLCEQKLINSMSQAGSSRIYDTVKELNLLVEIEKYWKNI